MVGQRSRYLKGDREISIFILDYTVKIVEWPLTQRWVCKNEPVILTLIWLEEFQCSIDNKYYASEV